MLAASVRFGCVSATDDHGDPVVIAWVTGIGGRLLWLAVVPVEE